MNHVIRWSEFLLKVKQDKPEISVHSGSVMPGGVFVALPPLKPGESSGESFIAEALAHSPQALVCRPAVAASFAAEAQLKGVEIFESQDPRFALGELAKARYGTDRLPVTVVGVTGTNGKTTSVHLLERIFSTFGQKVGVIGTISYRWPGHEQAANLTTPGCLEAHQMLSQMAQDGVGTVFMEVSSHALDQQRLAGIDFECTLFTNLTQDHLDYHGNMEEYYQAKSKLFLPPVEGRAAAINGDDPSGRRLISEVPGAFCFCLDQEPVNSCRHLKGEILENSTKGLRLAMHFEGKSWELSSPLIGKHNAMNLLGAQATALAMGISPECFAVLESYAGVPGRFERILNKKDLDIFVDYAHTPDALENVLKALRGVGFKRIITLFGCGGHRDRSKRPLMGQAVARYSDVAVLTSDNPRDEEPLAIMADVEPGLQECPQIYKEPDRRKALELAVSLMKPGDALMVAGKGHEDYQVVGTTRYPFSDQKILMELLA